MRSFDDDDDDDELEGRKEIKFVHLAGTEWEKNIDKKLNEYTHISYLP